MGNQFGEREKHKLWGKLVSLCVKMLATIEPLLVAEYASTYPKDTLSDSGDCRCFQVLGVDVMLDHKCKPFLIEVNTLPSFETDSSLDESIKERVVQQSLDLTCGSLQVSSISPANEMSQGADNATEEASEQAESASNADHYEHQTGSTSSSNQIELPVFHMDRSRAAAVNVGIHMRLFEPRYRILARDTWRSSHRLFLYATSSLNPGSPAMVVQLDRCSFCSNGDAQIDGTSVAVVRMQNLRRDVSKGDLVYAKIQVQVEEHSTEEVEAVEAIATRRAAQQGCCALQ